jgi:SAM-dependent methyltransferase/RimJ/RimL family protein N-acetyltransferase
MVQRAVVVLQTEGLRSLWFKALGETIYRRAVVLERSLDEPAPQADARLPVVFGRLQETEADEYAAFRPETDPAEVRRRLQAGEMCFVARHDGRLVHACWVATERAWIDCLDREIALAPGEAYIYESFTAPDFRGQNVAAARSAYMQQALREAGYRRTVAVVVPENKVAFRPIEKAGYRRVGALRTVRVGPWRRDFGRLSGELPDLPNPPAPPVPLRGFPAREGGASPPCTGEGLGEGSSPAYWDGVARQASNRPHYLDPFLGEMKRQAHLDLVERWGGAPTAGCTLKTDLFEEALGPDAFLTDLGGSLVVGMDVSPAIAGRAQQRDAGRRAAYVTADVRRLPFADGTFVLIVSPSTLDHFADPADLGRSLRELARVLDPAGRLVVTLDNRQNIFAPLLRLAGRLGRVPYYLGYSYTVAELRVELEAAGLAVQDTTAILHNPRLVATGAVAVANWLGWPPLSRLVRRALMRAQRLEGTRWQYRTGSFVAALAVRRPPAPGNEHG